MTILEAFEPWSFADTAERLLGYDQPTQADLRTSVGRAYYGVYGYFRARVLAAKGVDAEDLFGRAGLHGAIEELMAEGDFAEVHLYFSGLKRKRVAADYHYGPQDSVSLDEARSAVITARDAIDLLRQADELSFRRFPLEKKGGR